MPSFSFIIHILAELFENLTITEKYINKRVQLFITFNDVFLQNNALTLIRVGFLGVHFGMEGGL